VFGVSDHSAILANQATNVYLMHSKDEVLDKFKMFKAQVELQHETFIKCFRSDKGGEFHHSSYFESTGIVHQVTAPYTPK